MTKQEMTERARVLWNSCLRGNPLTEESKRFLIDAYWSNALPEDPDYSVYQWVEDGFPSFH